MFGFPCLHSGQFHTCFLWISKEWIHFIHDLHFSHSSGTFASICAWWLKSMQCGQCTIRFTSVDTPTTNGQVQIILLNSHPNEPVGETKIFILIYTLYFHSLWHSCLPNAPWDWYAPSVCVCLTFDLLVCDMHSLLSLLHTFLFIAILLTPSTPYSSAYIIFISASRLRRECGLATGDSCRGFQPSRLSGWSRWGGVSVSSVSWCGAQVRSFAGLICFVMSQLRCINMQNYVCKYVY